MEHDQQQQPMRRRRKAKGGGEAKKKQPRRGMGVEKLERLLEQGEVVTEADRTGLQPPVYHQFHPYGQSWNPVGFPGFYGLGGADRRLLQLGRDADLAAKNCDENVAKCFSLHCNGCHKKKRINSVLKQEMPQAHIIGDYGGNKVEIVAVHKRGSNWGNGGGQQRLMMEYDFFPAAAAAAAVEAGGGVVGDYALGGFEGSNCVDLSLKLSNY